MDLQSFLREKRGRTKELAKALRVSDSLVTQWAGGKPIAIERCPAIEKATGGLVRRSDLRPADWQEIWPELVGMQQAIQHAPASAAATGSERPLAGCAREVDKRQQAVVDRIVHGVCARPSEGKPR